MFETVKLARRIVICAGTAYLGVGAVLLTIVLVAHLPLGRR